MGNGWHEWPLMIFTVLGQFVAGALIVVSSALLHGGYREKQRRKIIWSMFALWVLMAMGFIASIMHLGSPLRAFNSLNRPGHSALSNEIASGSVFFAVGGFWWLLSVINKMPAALNKLWLFIAMVLGIVFVWMMARVYNSIDTVPTWHSAYTGWSFFLTLIIGGPLLGYLLLNSADVSGRWMRLLPVISCIAVLASAIVALLQGSELATIHSSVQQAVALIPNYGALMAWRLGLLAAALALWVIAQFRCRRPGTSLLTLALILMLAGELLGRGVFYGLHMTVGMAVAG